MPFTSKAQSRACYAKKSKGQANGWDCQEWADKTDYARLPEHKEASMSSVIEQLAVHAVRGPIFVKLAQLLKIQPDTAQQVCAALKVHPAALLKTASENPNQILQMVKQAGRSDVTRLYDPANPEAYDPAKRQGGGTGGTRHGSGRAEISAQGRTPNMNVQPVVQGSAGQIDAARQAAIEKQKGLSINEDIRRYRQQQQMRNDPLAVKQPGQVAAQAQARAQARPPVPAPVPVPKAVGMGDFYPQGSKSPGPSGRYADLSTGNIETRGAQLKRNVRPGIQRAGSMLKANKGKAGIVASMLAGLGGYSMLGGGGEEAPPQDAGPGPGATAMTGQAGGMPGMAGPSMGPAVGGGMTPQMKALLGMLVAGGGAYGVNRMMNRKKDRNKMGSDMGLGQRVVIRAIIKKAAERTREEAVGKMNRYLDKVASYTPAKAQVPLRTMQAVLAGGDSLSTAIKMAYPKLAPEARGILATRLAKGATDEFKSTASKTLKPFSRSGPIGKVRPHDMDKDC